MLLFCKLPSCYQLIGPCQYICIPFVLYLSITVFTIISMVLTIVFFIFLISVY